VRIIVLLAETPEEVARSTATQGLGSEGWSLDSSLLLYASSTPNPRSFPGSPCPYSHLRLPFVLEA